MGIAAAAAVALALAVLAGTRIGSDPGPAPPLELAATLTAPSGERARAEVTETGIGRVIEFRSDDLAILPKGEFYELWFVGPGDSRGEPNRISAGTFHPDPEGRSNVTFAAAGRSGRLPAPERDGGARRRRPAPVAARGAALALTRWVAPAGA